MITFPPLSLRFSLMFLRNCPLENPDGEAGEAISGLSPSTAEAKEPLDKGAEPEAVANTCFLAFKDVLCAILGRESDVDASSSCHDCTGGN